MATFVYTARDQSGNVTTGTVEAETNSRAVANLREQGLWVTDLKSHGRVEAGPSNVDASFGKRLRSPISLRDLSLFYRQFYTLLNSGMGLYQSLEMLSQSNQCSNPHLRRIVLAMSQHALQGGKLSEVMVRYPWAFDKMQVRMVEAGESGGLLVEVLRRLSEYLEREYQVRQDISKKTLYPKLVLALLVFVLPINVPLSVSGYLGSLAHLLVYVIGIGAVLWFVGRTFLTSQGGRQFADQVKMAVPVFGPLVQKMAVARFARCLAALYGAGVPIASALGMAGEASGNHVMEQHTRHMVPALERGMSVSQVLQATGIFPPMFLGMVSTGETSGNLDTMLDKGADFYEEEAAHAITQLVVILGVVLLICVAIAVAIKLISFYTGMLSGAFKAAGGAGE